MDAELVALHRAAVVPGAVQPLERLRALLSTGDWALSALATRAASAAPLKEFLRALLWALSQLGAQGDPSHEASTAKLQVRTLARCMTLIEKGSVEERRAGAARALPLSGRRPHGASARRGSAGRALALAPARRAFVWMW